MNRKNSRKKRKNIRGKDDKKLLLNEIKNLEQNVTECEEKLEKAKHDNLKAFHIRNLKVFTGTCNFLLPFVVMSGITVGGFKICNGGYPFYKDDVTRCREYEVECDLDNNINVKIEYVSNGWWNAKNDSASLTLYTPVEEDRDSYVCYKREYDLPDDCFDDLYEAIVKKDYDYIIENYEDYKEEKQTFNVLNEKDTWPSIEASLLKRNRDDILKFPESDTKNIIITIVELIVALGLGSFIAYKRDYDYFDNLKDIKVNYNSSRMSLELLEKELEEARGKLLTLTSKQRGKSNEKK